MVEFLATFSDVYMVTGNTTVTEPLLDTDALVMSCLKSLLQYQPRFVSYSEKCTNDINSLQ